MDENTDKEKLLRDLHRQVDELVHQHNLFREKIEKLQNVIFELRLQDQAPSSSSKRVQTTSENLPPPPATTAPVADIPTPPPPQKPAPEVAPAAKTPWEEFVGSNLLNKVGIAILVIGVAFGVKYSIDHSLIDDLTRIILGYISGIILAGIAIRLKKNYRYFSAVLLSGGMAVFYFITYAAYSFYDLIPREMAFVLMVLFTIFTVFAAIRYNLEVIGIIGLAGAYAVPFLLSDGSGNVMILFIYTTIINGGILALAFRKYWKRLYYISFVLTWLIFAAWYATRYETTHHFSIALVFSTVFFLTFHTTFLAYKLVRNEPLSRFDIVFILLNSFICYGFGYRTLEAHTGNLYLGLYTLFMAVLHFISTVILYRRQERLRDTFYFIAGMVLVFITLAVPVQLDGNWVTVIWASQAALLFWIGRTKKQPVYETLSYALILLTFSSLLHDWEKFYRYSPYRPKENMPVTMFLNGQFLTSMLATLALGFALWTNVKNRLATETSEWVNRMARYVYFGLPALTLFVLYFSIYLEIRFYWDQQYGASRMIFLSDTDGYTYSRFNSDLLHFKTLWLNIYSAVFAIALSILSLKFIRNGYLKTACLVFTTGILLSFIMSGLPAISELRESYLHPEAGYYEPDSWHIAIRYMTLLAVVPLLWFIRRFSREPDYPAWVFPAQNLFLHFTVLTLLSSELVHVLEMSGFKNSFKLVLSVLWGSYALFLITLGLLKNIRYIRIAAIVLFAVTLIKLFLYDLAAMSTIARTLVLISLGVLMLIASFLYNKYKRTAS